VFSWELGDKKCYRECTASFEGFHEVLDWKKETKPRLFFNH
jgi:hypothetical protein